MTSENQENKGPAITFSREFNAPRTLVYNAFSQAKHLAQWWGPVGYTLTVLSLDFRPGGMFHYKMESGERVMWARFVYGKIIKSELIEFVLSFSDEKGGITRAPFFDGQWPLEIHNKLTFIEKEGKTTILFQSHPLRATQLEQETYLKEQGSFRTGMGATLDQLVLLLSRLTQEQE